MTADQRAERLVREYSAAGHRAVEAAYLPDTAIWTVSFDTASGRKDEHGTYQELLATVQMRRRVAEMAVGPELARKLRRHV